MPAVQVRAADVDRERVLAELQQHTTAGRLSMDEFSERAAAVYRSGTIAELAALTADLPRSANDAVVQRVPWGIWIRVSAAGVALVLLAIAAFTPAGSMTGCI